MGARFPVGHNLPPSQHRRAVGPCSRQLHSLFPSMVGARGFLFYCRNAIPSIIIWFARFLPLFPSSTQLFLVHGRPFSTLFIALSLLLLSNAIPACCGLANTFPAPHLIVIRHANVSLPLGRMFPFLGVMPYCPPVVTRDKERPVCI